MSKTQTPRIERGTTYLVIPVNDNIVQFVSHASGPDTYNVVMQDVAGRGLNLATGEENAFLLDAVYNSDDQDFKNSPEAEFVRNKVIRDNWLWVPNVNVWTPRNIKNPGVYVVFDEKGEGLSKRRDINQLEEQLSGCSTERGVRFSKDRKVAFAPLNTISSGSHNKGTLAQDGAYIANYGVEGAERLDEVAKKFTFKPYSWIVDNDSNDQIQRLSALSGDWAVDVGLGAFFDYVGGSGVGYAFGKTGSK